MVYMTSELDFMMFSEIFLDILYLRERFLKKLGGSISFMKYNEKKKWDPILPVQSYWEKLGYLFYWDIRFYSDKEKHKSEAATLRCS